MDYQAATLNYLASKKKWYVYVTVPRELQAKLGKQVRRSTGTADKREAQRKLHDITTDIYAGFDDIGPDKFNSLVNELHELMGGPSDIYPLYQILIEDAELRQEAKVGLVKSLRDDVERYVGAKLVPSPTEEGVHIIEKQGEKLRVIQRLEELLTSESAEDDRPTFSAASKVFIEQNNFTREHVRKQAVLATREFSNFVGDKALVDIGPTDLYAYAEHLSSEIGLAKTTIRGRIDKVSLVFHHAVRKGFVPINPCIGLRMIGFGKERESYKPFTRDELTALFSLEMSDQERLVLQILALTGMRLDEAALLTWDEVTEEDGTALFDLTKRPQLRKNKGSARKIPVHPKLMLPPRGKTSERLFDYRTNVDGKTTTASESLMRHVRRITNDPLKVVHSLRHNFKDSMRDAGVSKETSDFLSGHASGDIAGRYGQGPSIRVRQEAITLLKAYW